MKLLARCIVLLVLVPAVLAGCGDDEDTVTAPTAPAATAGTTPQPGDTVTIPPPEQQAPTGEADATTESQPPASTVMEQDGAPRAAPPDAPGPGAPPPAWVATSIGRVWLGYGSYCWDADCHETQSEACSAETPEVQAGTNETLRFHLGFVPDAARLSVEGGRPQSLPKRRVIAWNADQPGLLRLDFQSGEKRVSYLACLTLLGV